jgi:hypothetical protein
MKKFQKSFNSTKAPGDREKPRALYIHNHQAVTALPKIDSPQRTRDILAVLAFNVS